MLEGQSSHTLIESMIHFCFRILCFFILISVSFSCQETDFDNLCDPKSKDYLESLVIRFINFDETSHCGVVLEVLPPNYLICPPQVPKPNGSFFFENFETDGNRLSFSSNPPFPSGISFSPFSNSLQGIYSGWKANRQTYTITASNPKGSASCTYNPAWMGKLPIKTKQTTCYDAINNPAICSSVPGQDGQFQKGTPQVFVGPTLIGSDEITTDLNTGLVWTSCQRGISGIGCAVAGTTQFTYADAFTECNNLNAGSGFANFTNWRVPEIDEYINTFDYSTENPSIDQTFFPVTDSFNFKTNTESTAGTRKFNATFIQSSIGTGAYSDLHYLRCVANSEPIKNKRLLDNGDGTILDLDTSLVWQRCTAGQTNLTTCSGGTDIILTWNSAVNYCQGLTLGGRTWRLPNISELRSLFDFYLTIGSPGIDPIYFPNTAIGNNQFYWSSTTLLSNPSQAYVAYFGSSSGGNEAKADTINNRIRCVSDF